MGKMIRKKRIPNAPTKVLPKRVKGKGLAYLLALEKGGSKRHLATAQAQVDAQESQDSKSVAITKQKKGSKETKFTKKFKQDTTLLKEPFKNGWKREVVYRATVDPGTKTLCDVYYYSPDGKKHRSGREVTMHLEKMNSSLSIENFTFFKDPIGIDSNQELVRYAKKRGDVKKEKAITSSRQPHSAKTAVRKKEAVQKKQKIVDTNNKNEELIRNLQELGGIIAEALKTAKCSTSRSSAGRPRRQPQQGSGNVMVQALQAQTFQTRALLGQFQSRSQKFRN